MENFGKSGSVRRSFYLALAPKGHAKLHSAGEDRIEPSDRGRPLTSLGDPIGV